MTNHIAGKTIIVTGAGSGFGRLVASKAASAGAKVVCGDVNAGSLDETVAGVRAANGSVAGLAGDVSDLTYMKALAAKAVEEFGSIDVLINNAGVMPLAFFRDHAKAADAWNRCIDVNIRGVMNGIIAVHDQMIAQGRGHVVNISSIYGNFPVAGAAVYGASKAAVNFFSDALRVESQGKIKVMTIKPTGVPATALGKGVINPEAIIGILGQNSGYLAAMGAMAQGKAGEGQMDAEDIRYLALDPVYIAEAVLHAIDQPWGVSIGEVTVRASGDGYIL
ncbi:MAG TPA: SDR family NAD(P)-dependent oxidoreductase [Rhizomicrobium sp.]|jgi:NADP-dependent 3-hydroxy acid dehydrogenase YdfG|nr:SDR family NAD(P)-dependent oxidoreductase [Rhizomicrobium sp.]